MAGAGLPLALPKIVGAVGRWRIMAAILLALGRGLSGYVLTLRRAPGERKVLILGTGQRNLAARESGADTFVATLVTCLVLTLVMHVIAAEWRRRTPDATEDT
jgi:hypothetical protein